MAARRRPLLLPLFAELVRLEIELWQLVDSRLRHDHGLPLNQFEPLQVLDRRGACRVQDVADELAITVGGASKLVDRLEAADLCRRRPNPDDGRSSLVALTDAGRDLLRQATATAEDELAARVGAALAAPDAAALTATLGALRAAARADGPARRLAATR